MVLALSVAPDFPQRSLLVTMTFGVVLLTILIQGTTMGPFLKRFRLVSASRHSPELDVARGWALSARAALAEIDRMRREFATSPDVLEPLRELYESSIREAEDAMRTVHDHTGRLLAEESRAARRHLLLTEKSSILEAFQQGLLGQEAFEKIVPRSTRKSSSWTRLRPASRPARQGDEARGSGGGRALGARRELGGDELQVGQERP